MEKRIINSSRNNNGKKNILATSEMTLAQKHRRNVLNRILNNYFGLVMVLAVLGIGFLSYKYILRPKYENIIVKINAGFSEVEQLTPKYKELENFKSLERSFKSFDSAGIIRLNELIPAEYIKEDLFVELLDLMNKKGLSVGSIDITKEGSSNGDSGGDIIAESTRRGGQALAETQVPANNLPTNIGNVKIKLVLNKADYGTLRKTMAVLENSLRLYDVKRVAFDPIKQQADLEIETYFVKK